MAKEKVNGVWTIGRKTAIALIIATVGFCAGAGRVTWAASAWSKGIEGQLTAIDQRLADQNDSTADLIDMASRLAVCESKIEDLRTK